MEKTIQRLMNAIKNGKFAFEKYFRRGQWNGIDIQIQGFYRNGRRIGYYVFVHDANCRHVATIEQNFEKKLTEVEYYN